MLAMPYSRPVDEDHYADIDQARAQFDADAAQFEQSRERLHAAVLAAFPESAGEPAKRGVLAEVARRAKFSREYVAQIRDGKAVK
jgi:hypothetical protein